MPPLPLSRSALDRLGERMIAGNVIQASDYDTLEMVLSAYQQAFDGAQSVLTALGFTATTRVKSTGTLLDKLRREHGMKLKGVQDVAGARIVLPGTKIDQDDVVREVVRGFEGTNRPPKVRGRRTEPSWGYRAVHIVVDYDGIPIEIQVRTELQDLWAQIVERLGDTWGRGIRYGELVAEPDVPAGFGDGNLSRSQLVSALMEMSDHIAAFEELQAEVEENLTDELTRRVLEGAEDIDDAESQEQWLLVKASAQDVKARLAESGKSLMDQLRRLVDAAESLEVEA